MTKSADKTDQCRHSPTTVAKYKDDIAQHVLMMPSASDIIVVCRKAASVYKEMMLARYRQRG